MAIFGFSFQPFNTCQPANKLFGALWGGAGKGRRACNYSPVYTKENFWHGSGENGTGPKKGFGSNKIFSVNNLSVPNFIRAEQKFLAVLGPSGASSPSTDENGTGAEKTARNKQCKHFNGPNLSFNSYRLAVFLLIFQDGCSILHQNQADVLGKKATQKNYLILGVIGAQESVFHMSVRRTGSS